MCAKSREPASSAAVLWIIFTFTFLYLAERTFCASRVVANRSLCCFSKKCTQFCVILAGYLCVLVQNYKEQKTDAEKAKIRFLASLLALRRLTTWSLFDLVVAFRSFVVVPHITLTIYLETIQIRNPRQTSLFHEYSFLVGCSLCLLVYVLTFVPMSC